MTTAEKIAKANTEMEANIRDAISNNIERFQQKTGIVISQIDVDLMIIETIGGRDISSLDKITFHTQLPT